MDEEDQCMHSSPSSKLIEMSFIPGLCGFLQDSEQPGLSSGMEMTSAKASASYFFDVIEICEIRVKLDCAVSKQ